MNLDQLVSSITELQGFTQSQATKQVNQWLTLRNWLIGAYIVEYENGGEDRAEYGAKVIDTLSSRLKVQGLKGMGSTNLRHFTTFYALYPNIRQSLTGILGQTTIPDHIRQSVTGISLGTIQEPLDSSSEPISPISAEQLLQNCSFTHFVEFIRIEDPIKRSFYEYQVVNQSWSVRQLKRATESMLYERTGLSTDKSGVVASFDAGKALTAAEIVRDPYFLEFLNLPEKAAYSESDLEQAIIDNLQDFLLEMGEGFCFEARQRRITFGNTHYHIDLVFYHRLLRCHILIDLKIGAFTHADTGQMNVYLNYYKDNIQTPHDNPPIGIILCADKDDSLVQYATGGLDQQLFVSQYQVKLPSESTLKQLLSNSISTLE